MQHPTARRGLALLFALFALTACGDDDGSSGGDMGLDAGGPSFRADVFGPIIQGSCAVSNCHGATATQANLLLDTADNAHANLVGVAAMGGPCTEDAVARTRVVAGDPGASLLIEKVTQEEPECGNRMPLVGTMLTIDQQNAIRDWISRGAPND
ncbi:MAG: hypothetical protein AAGH15_06730 [Myxococcota bacterium]